MSRRNVGVKVRGIYSTALTKLLLDHDYKIVQTSEEINDRFGLEALEREPDLSIRDRSDRQGVKVLGRLEDIEALRSVLSKELFDVIVRRKVVGGCLDVEFPWASKNKLDECRGLVVPTVKGHHFYKACGGEISVAADMAERLLFKGHSREDVEEKLRSTLMLYMPYLGSETSVEHVKLDGAVFNLGTAVIEEYIEGASLKYSRQIRSDGVYDGLGVRKNAGDLAISEAKYGEYCTVTKYFSQRGRFKGAYININTPLEVYPNKIRYIDLEVDVCVWPDGEVKVIDEDPLERAAEEKIISVNLFDAVQEEVEDIVTCRVSKLV